MVKLRLRRMGAKDQPFYRIVAVDSRKKRDGGYLENLGYYDPKAEPFILRVDTDKALKWLKVGAQPTETVRSLFSRAGVMETWHNIRTEKSLPSEDESAPAEVEVQEEERPEGDEQ